MRHSGLAKSVPMEEQVIRLLDELSPHANAISRLSEEDEVELSCVIYSSETPSLNFPKQLISKISALGASLDIDLYFVES